VLRAAGREVSAVARQKQREGWSDALVSRAGAALRIIGSYAIGRPAAQTRGLAAAAEAGQIALSSGIVRRRHALVSAAVTPQDLAPAAGRDGSILQIRDGLSALTAARFGRSELDGAALDTAMQAAGPMARSLALRYSWPAERWRALRDAIARWRGHA
jgi:hypothetical protein